MTDQATIFNAPADQPTTAAPVIDPNDPVALLVGENRKYKTIQELAKAYVHIDGFAEQLKDENSKLRQDLAAAKTIDDVLATLKAPAPAKADQPAPSVKTLGVEEIAAIVKQTVTGLETSKTREQNLLLADAKMRELFGDKAAEVFSKEAPTEQMRQALVQLASVSPDKFVALFAKPAPAAPVGSTPTEINTAALSAENISGRTADPGTKEYYNEMRRKNPTLYYSTKVQIQMQKAAHSNPAHFFGRAS